MNYQITCVCGNRFFADDSQLGRHLPCPVCNRALIPVTAQPETPTPSTTEPPAPPADAAAPEAVKRCPFCGETILAVARKCRFCNEFLDRAAAPAGSAALPDASAAPTAPEPIFTLSVSQWDNFWRFLICLIIIGAVGVLLFYPIPGFHALVQPYAVSIFGAVVLVVAMSAYFFYLGARNARCLIRPTRIETEVGIFSKKVDALDIFRITDLELRQGLIQRLLGFGTVVVKSTDPSTPTLELYQIPQARQVYKYLQEQIPKAEHLRGVVRVEK